MPRLAAGLSAKRWRGVRRCSVGALAAILVSSTRADNARNYPKLQGVLASAHDVFELRTGNKASPRDLLFGGR
jgi:hypothetical protein